MAKLTQNQIEAFADFAFNQHVADQYDNSASEAIRIDNKLAMYIYYTEQRDEAAAKAVLIARHEIGMTDDQITDCHLFLVRWAEAAAKKAAA